MDTAPKGMTLRNSQTRKPRQPISSPAIDPRDLTNWTLASRPIITNIDKAGTFGGKPSSSDHSVMVSGLSGAPSPNAQIRQYANVI